MKLTCVLGKCLSAGFAHQDFDFRNVVYDPVTLDVRLIDIEPSGGSGCSPRDLWEFLDGSSQDSFMWQEKDMTFTWGLSHVVRLKMSKLFSFPFLLLVIQFCYYLVKKKFAKVLMT